MRWLVAVPATTSMIERVRAPAPTSQDLDRRDVGVPGQHDVDLASTRARSNPSPPARDSRSSELGGWCIATTRTVPGGESANVARMSWDWRAEMRPDFHRHRGIEPSPWMRTVPRSRTGSRFSVTSARYLP